MYDWLTPSPHTHNQTLTTDSELVGKDGQFQQKAKLTGKYKHVPTGFAVDKLVLKETGGVSGEFSLSGVAKGVTFTFKVGRYVYR